MKKFTHLTLDDRKRIEDLLTSGTSFKAISRAIGKDCTTVSKEVRNHIKFIRKNTFQRPFNDCLLRKGCTVKQLCGETHTNCPAHQCSFCEHCRKHCPDYVKEICLKLDKPPYICNSCLSRSRCTLEKRVYQARFAHQEYREVSSESRTGVAIAEDEALALDALISPLLKRGLSLHHIATTYPDKILFSEKCLYNYLDFGLFSAINLDLPRKVRYRPRKSRHDSFKVDKACRIGRTFLDFLAFREEYPDLPLVELDSVIGRVGGKVLLTIHFVESQFMLAFLRDRNDSQSVIDIFQELEQDLGEETFQRLFPLCLTDNGSEFSNPTALEFNDQHRRRCHLFYCDPASPHQKGQIENNNSFIRRILPKGSSFDNLTQMQVQLMMNHINSYRRKKLGDLSPYEIFRVFHGEEILAKLGALFIPPHEITLRPVLLK